jgi:hypothetical protein
MDKIPQEFGITGIISSSRFNLNANWRRRTKSIIVQVYPDLCWVVRRPMLEESTNGGRSVSGSNRSFMEIKVVGVALAKLSSIWQGGWTNNGR